LDVAARLALPIAPQTIFLTSRKWSGIIVGNILDIFLTRARLGKGCYCFRAGGHKMKPKILSVNYPLNGNGITIGDFFNAPSFCDFDAVIVDPVSIPDMWSHIKQQDYEGNQVTCQGTDKGFGYKLGQTFDARRNETALLLNNGGVLVLFIRKYDRPLFYNNVGRRETLRVFDSYSWLPSGNVPINRTGQEIEVTDKFHPFSQFISTFKNELKHEAILRLAPDTRGLRIIATNKVNEVIAAEISFGEGKIIFLPTIKPQSGDSIRMIQNVFVNCIMRTLGCSTPATKPDWIGKYSLPGVESLAQELEGLKTTFSDLQQRSDKLEAEKNRLEMLTNMLYEQGKYTLEPSVREAFRIFGFNVTDPKDYEEEYDVYAPESDTEIIGEIEGTKNQVAVDKYRQLHDYVGRKVLDGIKCKGILIGNGLREKDPDERGEQFTDPAIRGCNLYKYCRITTYELFRAVKFLLARPDNMNLRASIKKEIINCEGEFKFDESKYLA
jgi:hypothetical protein